MFSLLSKRRGGHPHRFVVAMSGVQMGDRLVQVGCSDSNRLAAIAGKVGLSGRAAAVVTDDADAARIIKAASQAGVLIEAEVAPSGRLPFGDEEFDIAIIDNIGGLLTGMDPAARAATIREASRLLRPAGRVMVILEGTPQGIRALLATRNTSAPAFDPALLLKENGFGTPRVLADREGLMFVEALKPRK
jgi:ubiquinone/menaquinone biosynthesis C-methylase UbiE